jgi:hypothetical protein
MGRRKRGYTPSLSELTIVSPSGPRAQTLSALPDVERGLCRLQAGFVNRMTEGCGREIPRDGPSLPVDQLLKDRRLPVLPAVPPGLPPVLP